MIARDAGLSGADFDRGAPGGTQGDDPSRAGPRGGLPGRSKLPYLHHKTTHARAVADRVSCLSPPPPPCLSGRQVSDLEPDFPPSRSPSMLPSASTSSRVAGLERTASSQQNLFADLPVASPVPLESASGMASPRRASSVGGTKLLVLRSVKFPRPVSRAGLWVRQKRGVEVQLCSPGRGFGFPNRSARPRSSPSCCTWQEGRWPL